MLDDVRQPADPAQQPTARPVEQVDALVDPDRRRPSAGRDQGAVGGERGGVGLAHVAEDGKLLQTLRLPAGPGDVGKAYAAALSPDGALVAAGGWTSTTGTDESVYLFDRASGRLLRRVGGLPDVVHHLAFSPDGTRLAAALGSGGGVRLIDPAAGRVVAADEGYGGDSYGAAFDAAGRLATTSYDGKVRLYDPGLRLLRAAEAPSGKLPEGIAFSPDGKRLAVGYNSLTAVDVLDADTLQRLYAADTKGVKVVGQFELLP